MRSTPQKITYLISLYIYVHILTSFITCQDAVTALKPIHSKRFEHSMTVSQDTQFKIKIG